MGVKVQEEKSNRPKRWSTLFSRHRQATSNGAVLPVDEPAGGAAAEANGKRGPQVAFGSAEEGEGSRAASVRRDSDQEIQVTETAAEAAAASSSEDDDEAEEVSRIEFYRKDQAYYWLSNSSDHVVYLDGVRYSTAEHLFQALKFLPHRPDIATKVRKASSPLDAMLEARKHMADVQKGWIGKGANVAAMRNVLLLKFSQHSFLQRQLLLTGDSELVEASPTDAFWGSAAGANSGRIGLGRNELGKALSRTRETIRAQSGLGIGSGAKTV